MYGAITLAVLFGVLICAFIYLYLQTERCLGEKSVVDKKVAILHGRRDLSETYRDDSFFEAMAQKVKENKEKDAEGEGEGGLMDMIKTGRIFYHLKKAWEMPSRINALVEKQAQKNKENLTEEEIALEQMRSRFGDETVNPLFHVKLAKAMEPQTEEMTDILKNTQ